MQLLASRILQSLFIIVFPLLTLASEPSFSADRADDGDKVMTEPFGLTGRWEGTGNGRDDGGWQGRCNPMVFEFLHTATTFDIRQAVFKCGAITISWDPLAFDIVGDKLMHNGHELGVIGKNVLHYYAVSEETAASWEFVMTIAPSSTIARKFTYHEEQRFQGKGMTLDGSFKRR